MSKQKTLSIDSDLLDSIFTGIMEKHPWQSFLRKLRLLLDCHVASIRFHSYSLESSRPSHTDADVDADIDKIYEDFLALSCANEDIFSAPPPGEIITFGDIKSRDEMQKSKVYREFLVPNNIGDSMRFGLEEPTGMRCWIELSRPLDQPLFGPRERKLCQEILIYMKRALAMYSKIRRVEAEKHAFETLAEQLPTGIVILDENGHIVSTNDMADQLLADPAITILHQKLVFTDKELQDRFYQLLSKAVTQRSRRGIPIGIEALPVRRLDKSYIGLLIKAIPEMRWYRGEGYPAVAIYMCDPNFHYDTRQSFVSQLFGLSLSESALAILLSDGKTLSEAAIELNVSEHTTRTVSKRIFAKMGVGRQADLVRIILRSFALLK